MVFSFSQIILLILIGSLFFVFILISIFLNVFVSFKYPNKLLLNATHILPSGVLAISSTLYNSLFLKLTVFFDAILYLNKVRSAMYQRFPSLSFSISTIGLFNDSGNRVKSSDFSL